jgi:heterodisulfide reductase subunit B
VGTPYFPGCTLSTTATLFDRSGRAAAAALGLPLEELADWQCCGASFPLAVDNAMALIGPTRVLIRAEEAGDRLVTLCAVCYNVLKRTDALLRRSPEMLQRINWFVGADDAAPGRAYQGRLKVVHLLEMFRDDLGWEALGRTVAEKGTPRLQGRRIAPYYGCLLLRPPREMALDDPEAPTLLSDFLRTLGAEPVEFPFQGECCGSYLAASEPETCRSLGETILRHAAAMGAQALVTACPLCQYNLETAAARLPEAARLPVVYFTQLLAAALDLPPETWDSEGLRAAGIPLAATGT